MIPLKRERTDSEVDGQQATRIRSSLGIFAEGVRPLGVAGVYDMDWCEFKKTRW